MPAELVLTDASVITSILGIPSGTLRKWVNTGKLVSYAKRDGKCQYDWYAVGKLHHDWELNGPRLNIAASRQAHLASQQQA
jgi:hypothetical protein